MINKIFMHEKYVMICFGLFLFIINTAWGVGEVGNIQLKLKMVDENGNQLNNVYMDYTITRNTGPRGFSGERKDSVVNGYVEIEAKKCFSISVNLMAIGYREIHEAFSYKNPRPDVKILNNGTHLYILTTVMPNAGPLGEILDWATTLTSYTSNEIDGLEFSFDPKKERKIDIELHHLKSDSVLSSRSLIYIKLTPQKSHTPIKRYSNGNLSPTYDISIVLADKNSDSGFSLVDYKKISEKTIDRLRKRGLTKNFIGIELDYDSLIEQKRNNIITDMLYDMTTAPEKGYKKTLIIPDDLWKKEYPVCFYIKINNFYGKGYIDYLYNMEHRGKIAISIKIFMENDGTRNVRTNTVR